MDSAPSVAFEQAIELLEAEGLDAAISFLVEKTAEAVAEFGEQSPQAARAHNDEGFFCLQMGELDLAEQHFAAASEGPFPLDVTDQADRLSYQLNHGFVLDLLGRRDESGEILHENLRCRAVLYGSDHPGYAHGLDALCAYYLGGRQWEELLECSQQAAAIHINREELLGAVVDSVLAHAMLNSEQPFETLQGEFPSNIEPNEVFLDMLGRAMQLELADGRELMDKMLAFAAEKYGRQDQMRVNVLMATANMEADAEAGTDHQRRIAAVTEAAAIYSELGMDEDATDALLGVAMAQGDAGLDEEAINTYHDVMDRSREFGDMSMVARTQRNYGVYLSEINSDKAEVNLRQAIEVALESGDTEIIARCQIALGVFLQHAGNSEDAKQLLIDGMAGIDRGHPDAMCASGHLDSMESGGDCGCSHDREEEADPMADTFRKIAMSIVDPDLVEDVRMKFVDGEPGVDVTLRRELNDGELQLVNDSLDKAVQEFRRFALEN